MTVSTDNYIIDKKSYKKSNDEDMTTVLRIQRKNATGCKHFKCSGLFVTASKLSG